jgi:uncharacterized membrane protein YjfL (UPF0719 family)
MIIKIIEFILIFIISAVILIAFFMTVIRKAFNIINEITPDVDEVKEILRGNVAVSEYFSRIVSSTIIGISIILSVIIIISFLIVK